MGSQLPWDRRGPHDPGDTASSGQQVEQGLWGLPTAGGSQQGGRCPAHVQGRS